jgi:small-conductance mechanosensitive channel
MSGGAKAPVPEPTSVLSHRHMREALSLADGARQSIAMLEDFFAIELPRFLFFSLLFSIGIVLSYIMPLLLEDALLRAGVPHHHSWVSRQLATLVLAIGSLALALLAVGVSLAQYVVAFGLIGTAIVITLQPILGAVTGGLWAQAFDVIEIGRVVEVNGYRGTVVATNLAFVTMRVEDTGETAYLPNAWFGVSQYPVRLVEKRRAAAESTLERLQNTRAVDKQS